MSVSNPLSPTDLVASYWNISVGGASVSINKYMTGVHTTGKEADRRNAVRGKALQQKKIINEKAFTRASMGKVSPQDCEHILTLAYDTGYLKVGDLQGFADECLGVDCTGFTVVYFDQYGRIDLDKWSGGVSCPSLVTSAKRGKLPNLASHILWDENDFAIGDMLVFMTSSGVETRKPGHIAVIAADCVPGSIIACESSGSPDGSGHSGPRNTSRRITDAGKEGPTGKYIELDGVDKCIVVRPPPKFVI